MIDCDNISWRKAAAVVAEAATHGVLGVKRGYGDWGSAYLTGWREQLTPLAIQPVQQIAYVAGKGATDIALVIDAMDLLYSGQVDTFCLVASDSDYTRLAMRLREAGKRVVGMGGKQTPAAFSNACDRFTFVEVLEGGAGGPVTAEVSAEGEQDEPDSGVGSTPPVSEITAGAEVPQLEGSYELRSRRAWTRMAGRCSRMLAGTSSRTTLRSTHATTAMRGSVNSCAIRTTSTLMTYQA